MENDEFKEMYKDYVRTGNATCPEMMRVYGHKKIDEFLREIDKRDKENEEYIKKLKSVNVNRGVVF